MATTAEPDTRRPTRPTTRSKPHTRRDREQGGEPKRSGRPLLGCRRWV